jgi:hypothetical protein
MSGKDYSIDILPKRVANYAKNTGIYFTKQTPDIKFAALSLMSIYDMTPINKVVSNHFNGAIEQNEFGDTKEEYEATIREIKKDAKASGRDFSNINFPSYEEMCKFVDKQGIEYEELEAFMTPHRSVEAEIGLEDIKYRIISNVPGQEVRSYENGVTVEIYRKNVGIYKISKYDPITAISVNKYFSPKTGVLLSYVERNGDNYKYYDRNGNNSISNKDFDLVMKLYTELNKRNFLNLPVKSDKLESLLSQITNKNAYEIAECYYDMTGSSLFDDIYNESSQNTLLSNLGFGEKKTEVLAIDLLVKMSHYYEQGTSIPNFSKFTKDCDLYWIVELLDDLCKNDKEEEVIDEIRNLISVWPDLTGRNNLIGDIENSDIPKEKKVEYRRIFDLYADKYFNAYDPHLTIENSQVNNEYHTGDEYEIKYDNDLVYIKNKTKDTESKIDMNKLFSRMSQIDKRIIRQVMQTLPGEVLDDLSKELDAVLSSKDWNMRIYKANSDFVASGFYKSSTDTIIMDVSSAETLVHELGHAIDSGTDGKFCSDDKDFNAIFEEELAEYKNKNFTQYSFEKGYENKEKTSNYATATPKEMFAECYTILMLGESNSKKVIIAHFPRCLKEVENIINKRRSEPDNNRHSKLRY